MYTYENEGNRGFSSFLSLSDGTMLNIQKIQYLKEVCVRVYGFVSFSYEAL